MLMSHGFPAEPHQFRGLIGALRSRHCTVSG